MEFPKGLANNPFVTIPFGIIIGFILNTTYKFWKNNKTTKQILIIVHNEIIDNLSNPSETIKDEPFFTKRFKFLNTVSGNVFRSKIGNLTISPEQIQSILKIYNDFDSINEEITNIRKNTKSPEVEIICKKSIQNYYSDCKKEISKYQERWKPGVDLEKFNSINKVIKNQIIGKTKRYLGRSNIYK
ncbi:hypothetical protein ES707_09869 [subsurface metagenome]